MIGVGLYIEENSQEILGRFHAAVERELQFQEAALRLAAPILLHDIARAMRRSTPSVEPWRRAVLLVLSQPEGGVRGLVREFGLLRQAIWDTLAARGHAVPSAQRRQVERLLDEALASAAERWAGLVRLLPIRERHAARNVSRTEPAAPPHPPPARAGRPTARPPPLPRRPGPEGSGDPRH
jgi:hypothetical protein